MFSKPPTSDDFTEGEDIYHRLRKNRRSLNNGNPYSPLQWSNVLKRMHERFIKQYGVNHHFPLFRWQESFRDHIIRDDHDYINNLNYLYNNALKHGLKRNAEKYLNM